MKLNPNIFFVFFIFFSINNCFSQGALDETFGDNGKVLMKNLGGYEGYAVRSAFIQPDGKSVIAGEMINTYITPAFGVIRYNVDGTLDASFGNNGLMIDTFNVDYIQSSNTCASIQADGKIVVSGLVQSINDNDSTYIAFARYLPDGALDATFGTHGNTIIPGKISSVTQSIILNDGKIVIGGLHTYSFSNTQFVLIGLDEHGNIDSSFGTNGYIYQPAASYQYNIYLNILTTDNAGNFLLAGAISHNPDEIITDYLLVRFTPTGKFDSSFGNNGIVTMHSADSSFININSIAVQADKKIIVTGKHAIDDENAISSDFLLTRFSNAGLLDSSFGVNGNVITKFPGINAKSISVIIEDTSGIIVSGTILDQYNQYVSFILAKYHFNGILDSIFGNNGLIITNFDEPSMSDIVCLQSDKKIIQFGNSGMGHGVYPALARYLNDDSVVNNINSLEAAKKDFSILITWVTEYERNSAYFIIERSNDSSQNFKEIGKLNSLGFSNKNEQYSFEDLSPFAGNNYYKIKLVDKKGNVFQETRLVVNFNEISGLKIFPNPAQDYLTLQGLGVNSNADVSIINIKGSVVKKIIIKNSSYTWDIKNLSPGQYFIKIKQDGKLKTLSFIKL